MQNDNRRKDFIIRDLKYRIVDAEEHNEIYIRISCEEAREVISYLEQNHELTTEYLKRIASYG